MFYCLGHTTTYAFGEVQSPLWKATPKPIIILLWTQTPVVDVVVHINVDNVMKLFVMGGRRRGHSPPIRGSRRGTTACSAHDIVTTTATWLFFMRTHNIMVSIRVRVWLVRTHDKI